MKVIPGMVLVLWLSFMSVNLDSVRLTAIKHEEHQMSDEKAIEALISDFIKAYNSGDLDSILKYYGDDLIKVRNGAAPENKSEVARRIKDVFEKFNSRVEVVNDETRVYGETAFTRGSFKVTLTPKAGGQAQVLDRRYLEIWHKENGHWVVVRAMDNLAQ